MNCSQKEDTHAEAALFPYWNGAVFHSHILTTEFSVSADGEKFVSYRSERNP